MSIAPNLILASREKIRFHRILRAWSQEDLAERANVQLSTVQRIEGGKQNPKFQTIRKFAGAYGIEPEELSAWHCAADGLSGNIKDESVSSLADGHGALLFLNTGEAQLSPRAEAETVRLAAQVARIALMMNRRELMQALASTVLAGAADPIQSIQYGLDGRKVGGEVAEWARDQIAILSHLDDQMGGKQLYPLAQSNLNLLHNLLQMRAVSGPDEHELRLALAHTASQAGWFAQDAELHDLAAQNYRFGIEMARSVGDRDFAAYCMMWLASQAIVKGKPNQCLSQLDSAEAEAEEDSPLRNHLLNFAVKAQGLLGDYKAAGQSLARAEGLYDKLKADRVPEYLYWMRRPSLTETTPRAFLRHDPRLAAKFSEDALAQITPEFTRDRMIMLVELAKAKHALGDTDEAVSRAGEVLQTVTSTAMPRVEKHLSEFHAQLSDDPVARLFKQRFAEYKRSRIAV